MKEDQMKEEQIIIIIEKYLGEKASSEEIKQLDKWFASFDNNPSLITSLSSRELKNISDKMFSRITDAMNTSYDNTLIQ